MIATRRFTILLDTCEAEALMELARQELRPTRDQARALLREALHERGLLSDTAKDCAQPGRAGDTSGKEHAE